MTDWSFGSNMNHKFAPIIWTWIYLSYTFLCVFFLVLSLLFCKASQFGRQCGICLRGCHLHQSRSMSDPTFSDIDFKNKMALIWITLKCWRLPTYNFDARFITCHKNETSDLISMIPTDDSCEFISQVATVIFSFYTWSEIEERRMHFSSHAWVVISRFFSTSDFQTHSQSKTLTKSKE